MFRSSTAPSTYLKRGGVYESVECEHGASQIMQPIGVMEGILLLPGFDDEEVDGYML